MSASTLAMLASLLSPFPERVIAPFSLPKALQ
jgi:hypothetical protein